MGNRIQTFRVNIVTSSPRVDRSYHLLTLGRCRYVATKRPDPITRWRNISHNIRMICLRRVRKNCEKRILASSCLPVYAHETTLLPLAGFAWHFIFDDFSKSFEKIQVSLKCDRNKGTLRECLTRWLLKTWNVSHKSCR